MEVPLVNPVAALYVLKMSNGNLGLLALELFYLLHMFAQACVYLICIQPKSKQCLNMLV